MSATGWVALAGHIVGTVESWEMVYAWDHRYHATKRAAVTAGFPLAGGTDDFNIGKVDKGHLTWFGWMDKQHPEEDYAAVAAQFGWTAP
jgi:hypothetical protein